MNHAERKSNEFVQLRWRRRHPSCKRPWHRTTVSVSLWFSWLTDGKIRSLPFLGLRQGGGCGDAKKGIKCCHLATLCSLRKWRAYSLATSSSSSIPAVSAKDTVCFGNMFKRFCNMHGLQKRALLLYIQQLIIRVTNAMSTTRNMPCQPQQLFCSLFCGPR